MLQSTERKREILSTSLRLFRENGYTSTSVRDIAKELNIEAASLYSHIESKEDILKLTCFEMADRFELAIKEVNDIYFNAEERLRMAIQFHVEILTSNLDASVVFIREWRNLSEEARNEFIQKRHRYEEGIRSIIDNGIDEGTFNQIDVKFASLTILSSVNWIVEWFKSDGSLSPNEVAEKLSDFVLTGLKAQRPTQLF
jgi:AcrR family transcriptional regulator